MNTLLIIVSSIGVFFGIIVLTLIDKFMKELLFTDLTLLLANLSFLIGEIFDNHIILYIGLLFCFLWFVSWIVNLWTEGDN